MVFDAQRFLRNYAEAYNTRNVRRLASIFALEDPGFCVFEEFSGGLLYGMEYGEILETVREATGRMSFELLHCSAFGDHALIHAIQRIEDPASPERVGDATMRVSLCVGISDRIPRVVSGHFSSMMLCFPKGAAVLRRRLLG